MVFQNAVKCYPPSLRPAEPCPYNLEVVDYLSCQYTSSSNKSHSSSVSLEMRAEPMWTQTKAGREWHTHLMTVVDLLPSAWYGELSIFCDPCELESRVKSLTESTKQSLFRTVPTTPVSGKWLKCEPARDFTFSTCALGNLLQALLRFCFKAEMAKVAGL